MIRKAYGWYLLITYLHAATVLPALVLAILILWFGFGIRWGW